MDKFTEEASRKISIPLYEILDLLVAAETYGYDHPIFYAFVFEYISPLNDREIEDFAQLFLTKKMQDRGYGKEDYENVKTSLKNLKTRWGK